MNVAPSRAIKAGDATAPAKQLVKARHARNRWTRASIATMRMRDHIRAKSRNAANRITVETVAGSPKAINAATMIAEASSVGADPQTKAARVGVGEPRPPRPRATIFVKKPIA